MFNWFKREKSAWVKTTGAFAGNYTLVSAKHITKIEVVGGNYVKISLVDGSQVTHEGIGAGDEFISALRAAYEGAKR